jgi:hypothetical protein
MIFFLLLFLSFPTWAETYICPPEIESEQKILSVPKGRKTEEERLNVRQSLSQISFYKGTVNEGGREWKISLGL